MKNILKIVLLIVFAFASCEKNVEEDSLVNIGEGGGESEVCDPGISFSTNIQPIINNECTRCHDGGQFPDLRTYSGISANASNIRSQVVSRRMPQGGSLSNDQIALISCWIDNGALNN